MKGLYGLRIGRKREDWKTKEIKYQGDVSCVSNIQGTLEQIKEVIKILDIDCYQIEKFPDEDHFSFGEVVEQTQDIINWHNEMKDRREKHNAAMLAKVERINKLPKTFEFKTYGISKLTFKRNEAFFSPTQSSRIIGGEIGLQKETNGRTNDIWLYQYVSKNGRLLKKSFKESMSYAKDGNLIGDDLENIITKQNELKKLVANI